MSILRCCMCENYIGERSSEYYVIKGDLIDIKELDSNILIYGTKKQEYTIKVYHPDYVKCYCHNCFEQIAGKDFL